MKQDYVVLRYRRMVARRDRWAAKMEQASRLFAKAERKVREYERRHGDRLAA